MKTSVINRTVKLCPCSPGIWIKATGEIASQKKKEALDGITVALNVFIL